MLQKCREYLLPVNSEEHLMVQRVLERLIPHSGLESEEWKVHVIADGQVNAFVIPGGKVFVQTGMLGICKGDDELAAVLGHEIAHNVAHHVGESISKSFGWILLACGISFAANIDLQIGRLLAKYIFELPNSRAQESEADFIGLMIMAQSCYPPEAAIRLWGRMKEEEQNSGRATPEFFSTHPSDHSRILRLQEWLPEAQQKLHDSECAPLEIHAWNFRQAQLDFPRW
jgi:predicted Zn-dependent protease